MEAWNELLKHSLLGVERQPLRMPLAQAGLGDLLARLDAADKEAALLRAAGAVATFQLAGVKAQPAPAAPVAPPAETRPVFSQRSTKHFSSMLEDLHTEVLPEWLDAALKSGKRLPEEWLPAALNLGQRRREFRGSVTVLVGERGRWLGAQNPEWSYACGGGEHTPKQAQDLCDVSPTPVRLEILAGVLRASPTYATELLRSTWKEDAAPDRAQFLNLCQQLANEALEEAFLEQCLDDKRKEVREGALQILQTRTGTQLLARQTERAKKCVKLAAKGKKIALEITLPEACDKSMERDGIDPKDTPFKMGEKAAILYHILCGVPPRVWTESAPIAQWIAAAKDSDHDALMLQAWRVACVRFKASDWAEALLDLPLEKKQSAIEHDLPFKALTPDRKESYLLAEMKECGGRLVARDEGNLLALLNQCEHEWSPAFSRLIVKALKEQAAGDVDWQLRSQLRSFARRIPVELNAEIQKGWPVESDKWDSWREQVDGFLSLLQFRYDFHQALKEA